MYSVIEIQKLLEAEIKNLNYSNNPTELYDPIKYVMDIGGKRLRPTLTILACNLFTDNIDKAIKPAIGFEMFHNFTLLHDDIMDNAPIRRNKPTVHAKWNNNIAILSGDAMMIKSFEYFHDCDKDILRDVMAAFNKSALQVCEGQQFDMNFESTEIVSIDEYMKMIELKTAVLLAGGLKVGAIVGRADKADVEHLYNFGINMGLAFQLQDDYLDTFGDVKIFGKKIGGDIVSNKKTFLLISALNLANGNQLDNLNNLLHNNNISSEEKISLVTGIFNSLNIKELSVNKINDYFALALDCLNKVNVDDNRKEILRNLVLGLKFREN